MPLGTHHDVKEKPPPHGKEARRPLYSFPAHHQADEMGRPLSTKKGGQGAPADQEGKQEDLCREISAAEKGHHRLRR